LDVRRPNPGIVAATVSHIAGGKGDGGYNRFSMGASDYKLKGRRNAESVIWADLHGRSLSCHCHCHKGTRRLSSPGPPIPS
jgi:hypothetical protein